MKDISNYLQDVPTSWTDHIHFAQWIVKRLNPDVIVDLGVDFGYSTFCFASPGIGKVYGIDSFEGDPQAGYRNTYQFVINKKDEIGLNNIKFLKGFFNPIAKKWKKPIDILHIDGFHSYHAVKNDYETWGKFVKNDGIILMHDTCIKTPGYEVYKFFEEIDLPKINFTFSYGLGVISKDKELIEEINSVFSLETPLNFYL